MNHHNSSNVTYNHGQHTAAAISGFCFLLGISGNIAVVVFLLRHFKRDNFALKLMLNLAASDILCLLALPLWIYNIIFDWTMGLALCKLTYFVASTGLNSSIFSVTLMSVHRYVMVLHHLMWNKLGQRGERAILACVWVLAGVMASAPVITSSVIINEGKKRCEPVVRSESEKIASLLPVLVFLYLITLTILITSYICLQRKVIKRAMTNYKMAPLVTAIILTFVIFSTPFNVVSIMIMATPSQPDLTTSVRKLAFKGPRLATLSIVFLNSCVNPLLYAFNFRTLRQSADKNVLQTSNTP